MRINRLSGKVFKLGCLLILISSCSPLRRAEWHINRARKLDPTSFVSSYDTIIREKWIPFEKIIEIHKGDSGTIKGEDTLETERTTIIVTKINDTCVVSYKEKAFKINIKDSVRISDTTIYHFESTPTYIRELKWWQKILIPFGYFGILMLFGALLYLYRKR